MSAILTVFLICFDLSSTVRASAEQGDFAGAGKQIEVYVAEHGVDAESVFALGTLSRAALQAQKMEEADRFAKESYRQMSQIKGSKDPRLSSALTISMDVQAQVLVAQGRRTEAMLLLRLEQGKNPLPSIQSLIESVSLTGKPAPAIQGVSLPAGTPVLLVFWSPGCATCEAEAPMFARLKKEYEPLGLALVGPTEAANPAQEAAHIDKTIRDTYTAVADNPAPVSGQNFRNFGISTTPTFVVIDTSGMVRLYHPGGMTYDELKGEVEAVLKKP